MKKATHADFLAMAQARRERRKKASTFQRAEDLAREVIRQGVHSFWEERIREMADHAMCMKGRPGGDREDSALRLLEKVNSSWPLEGEIKIERVADGKRMRLVLDNRDTFQIGWENG